MERGKEGACRGKEGAWREGRKEPVEREGRIM